MSKRSIGRPGSGCNCGRANCGQKARPYRRDQETSQTREETEAMNKAAVIYARKQNKKGVNPKTGLPWRDGDEFQVQSKRLELKLMREGYEVTRYVVDTSDGTFPKHDTPVDFCAVFTHGFPTYVDGAPRKRTTALTAENFYNKVCRAKAYNLFACSTAKTDYGFAADLSWVCHGYVAGHAEPGHTVQSPKDVLFCSGELLYRATKLPGGLAAWQKWLSADPNRPFETHKPTLWMDYLNSRGVK